MRRRALPVFEKEATRMKQKLTAVVLILCLLTGCTAPAAERAAFRGQVWLLVGPTVCSAGESFTVFSQAAGFATLVG